MFGYYYYDPVSWIFMLISMAVAGWAHFKVNRAFEKYSKISCSSGLTGAQAAEKVLSHNKVEGVSIERTRGYFTDYYDSRSSKICLSDKVYASRTIASVSVAAHESGHASQNAADYLPYRIRHALVPICNFGSQASMPLIILGILIPKWSFMISLGIIFFSLAVLFQIVTLPVEFDASRRALAAIEDENLLSKEELAGAKEVLTAAAFTYVAAAFSALLSLLRLLWETRGSRRRD